jgi:hypothetical protein
MKSLEKMTDRLIIQDKSSADHGDHVINLAKISIGNFISNINDREKV